MRSAMVRKVDELGRVVIPKEMRRVLNIKSGSSVELDVNENNEIVLKKFSELSNAAIFAEKLANIVNSTYNIPGTSYWSPVTGSTSSFYGSNNSFGIGSIGSYSGFPSGAAPVSWGLGSVTGGAAGVLTGGAASASTVAGLSAASYGAGLVSTGFNFGETIILPTAGLISGLGGIMQSMAPYLGTSGLAAIVAGNLFEGTGSAALSAYQNLTGRVTTNADAILSNKVRNIETVVKMLDTQADIVRQSLKDGIEGDNDAISDIS